jgi:hypothetical protein
MGKQTPSRYSTTFSRRPRGRNPCRDKLGEHTAQREPRVRRTIPRFFKRSEDLDIEGLGSKVCEVLGIRSGDIIQFHVLADGSVRIVNYGDK